MKADVKPRARSAAQDLSKQRLRLWLRLLRATRAIERELRERLRVKFGITLPQFDVMAALYRREHGMTMTELSRMLLVSNGNVTGIIDRLVNDRLVARVPSTDDRRAIMVRLTAKGAARFAAIARAHQDWIDRILADLDGEEADVIIRHLDGLPARISNGGVRS